MIGLAACGDDDGPLVAPPGPGGPGGTRSVAVSLSPTSVTMAQGANATTTITLTRTGTAGAVDLTLEGAPTGVTAAFAPASVGATATTSTLTVTAASTAAAGTYQATVRARSTGATDGTAALTIVVTAAATPAMTLTVAPATLSVAQGANGTATATITRTGGFTGPVNLAVTGAPTGVTATITPNPATAGTATITVAVAAGAAVGSSTLTVTGTGTGVANQTATIALTVTAAPSFTLALSPTTATVARGNSTTTTATITRSGGFTGAVALAVTGQPAGVTATVDPASIAAGATTATITVAVATSVAAGTYTLTVTGTGTGVANQTATFAVNVTVPATTSSTFAFCADQAPLWVAFQDGDGAWTRVTATGTNSYTFQFASGRGGVAYVQRASDGGTATTLSVFYATSAQLAGTGGTTNVACTLGGKTVNGSVAGLSTDITASESATIAFASSTASATGATPNFQLTNVPEGSYDLIASRTRTTITGTDFTSVVNRIIIRRNLNPANGSTLPVLDFAGAESFAPASANLTIANLGTDQALASVSLNTANGTSAAFYASSPSTTATRPYYGVPDAQLISSDLHSASVIAFAGTSTNSVRMATLYFRSVTDRTVNLGAALGDPTFTSVATAPYLRYRAQLPLQAEYNQLGGVSYSQSAGSTLLRSVSVFATKEYVGTGAYDLTIPDLSAAAGWDNSWGLQAGATTNWSAFEFGGSFLFGFPGRTATDGATVVQAFRSGTL